MRVIARKALKDFWQAHAGAEASLRAWYKEASVADWQCPQDIKQDYPSADVLAGNRIVFNIRGNRYRLIVRIHYNTRVVYIRFIGTHAEYDRINAETV